MKLNNEFKVIIENDESRLEILTCNVGIMEFGANNEEINKIELLNCNGIKYDQKKNTLQDKQ
jgi:hypothetical protein